MCFPAEVNSGVDSRGQKNLSSGLDVLSTWQQEASPKYGKAIGEEIHDSNGGMLDRRNLRLEGKPFLAEPSSCHSIRYSRKIDSESSKKGGESTVVDKSKDKPSAISQLISAGTSDTDLTTSFERPESSKFTQIENERNGMLESGRANLCTASLPQGPVIALRGIDKELHGANRPNMSTVSVGMKEDILSTSLTGDNPPIHNPLDSVDDTAKSPTLQSVVDLNVISPSRLDINTGNVQEASPKYKKAKGEEIHNSDSGILHKRTLRLLGEPSTCHSRRYPWKKVSEIGKKCSGSSVVSGIHKKDGGSSMVGNSNVKLSAKCQPISAGTSDMNSPTSFERRETSKFTKKADESSGILESGSANLCTASLPQGPVIALRCVDQELHGANRPNMSTVCVDGMKGDVLSTAPIDNDPTIIKPDNSIDDPAKSPTIQLAVDLNVISLSTLDVNTENMATNTRGDNAACISRRKHMSTMPKVERQLFADKLSGREPNDISQDNCKFSTVSTELKQKDWICRDHLNSGMKSTRKSGRSTGTALQLSDANHASNSKPRGRKGKNNSKEIGSSRQTTEVDFGTVVKQRERVDRGHLNSRVKSTHKPGGSTRSVTPLIDANCASNSKPRGRKGTNKETGSSRQKMEGNAKSGTVAPEILNYKRSRSGRLLMPAMEFWRNQIAVYDAERRVTGIQEGLPAVQSSRGSKSEPLEKQRRR